MRILILGLFILCNPYAAWSQYTILGTGFVDFPGSAIEVPNMPRVRNQKHMGICWGVAATTLAQKYYCDIQRIGDCAKLPLEKEISVLDLMSWENLDEKKKKESIVKNDRKIRFGLKAGGNSISSLFNSQENFAFKKESCFPLDLFFEKFGETKENFAITVSRMNLFFETYKIQPGTGDIDYKNAHSIQEQECSNCSAELVAARKLIFEMFPLDKQGAYYGAKISFGLTKPTFDHFIYEVLFAAGCKNIPMPSIAVHQFPAIGQRASKQELTEKLKKVLNLEIPVGIHGIRNKDGAHALVISGFKEVCGGKTNNCFELIKVHNSWGEEWQKSANGGWVRWDVIFNALEKDLIYGYQPAAGAIFWITERENLDIKLSESIPVGSSASMEPRISGVEFSSWDHSICKVSDQGVVTGVKPGMCVLSYFRGRKGYPLVTKVTAP